MRSVLAGILLVVTTGCGSHAQLASEPKSEAAPHVFVAVMGGNQSCLPDDTGAVTPYGIKMYPHFKDLMAELRDQGRYRVDYLVSCFDSDAVVHYYASNAPNDLLDMAIEEVPAKIQQLTAGTDVGDVYLAGHSYGGWMAMKTGLALDAGQHLNGLFTIDPISRANCSFSQPLGCQQAPTDIVASERETLHGRSGRWDNFYQTGTFYLHSSAIDEADQNVHVQGVTHFTIQTTDDVWSAVAQRIKGQVL